MKVTLAQIQRGSYVLEENEPAYVLMEEQQKMYRCNVIATVIAKEEVGTMSNLLLDDGTGQALLRSFEPSTVMAALQPGDVVLVIGKVRVFNREKYVSPELVKKVHPLWLKVRVKELIRVGELRGQQEMVVEEVAGEEVTGKELPGGVLVQQIRERDQGQGVLIEELILSPEAEEAVEKLLREGVIFQNLPGRVKVL